MNLEGKLPPQEVSHFLWTPCSLKSESVFVEWQIRRAKVTGKSADQDLVKKRFPVHFKSKI